MKRWQWGFNPKQWSITAKLSIALVGAAIIPIWLTAFPNLYQSEKTLTKIESENLELLAISTANRLDQMIVDTKLLVKDLSEDDLLRYFLSATPEERASLLSRVDERLGILFPSNPNFRASYLIDKKGYVVAYVPTLEQDTAIKTDLEFLEDFRVPMSGQTYVSTIRKGYINPDLAVHFAAPVRKRTTLSGSKADDNRGEIVGVAVLEVKAEAVWQLIDPLKIGKEGYAFLINSQGIVIAHPNQSCLDKSLASLSTDVVKEIATNRNNNIDCIDVFNIPELAKKMVGAKKSGYTRHFFSLNGKHKIVGFAPLDHQQWVVGVIEPEEEFLHTNRQLEKTTYITVILVGGIAAIGAFVLAQSIVRPIHALTAAAHALEEEKFEPEQLTDASKAQDDIGQLARVFLEMAEQVTARAQKLKQQVMELQIEIDQTKKKRQVAEITESDYFQDLQKKARDLRKQAKKFRE
ncbi:MAG: cache domain-containing protein [Xenococcaceae cyanobacterium]